LGLHYFTQRAKKLNLTKEQLEKLVEMNQTIVPNSAKMAKQVKEMELKLANNI